MGPLAKELRHGAPRARREAFGITFLAERLDDERARLSVSAPAGRERNLAAFADAFFSGEYESEQADAGQAVFVGPL
jgi:hypothetical protein